MMKKHLQLPLLLTTAILPQGSLLQAQLPEPSMETAECIMCHEMATPGIVLDWERSRHARITPLEALAVEGLGSRMSSKSPPEEFKKVPVGCYECHSLKVNDHADAFEHFGFVINLVVSPRDCSTCHPDEMSEFADSKKAHAIANLHENPVYHALETAVIGLKTINGNSMTSVEPSINTAGEACYACHGTILTVEGMKTVETDLGDVEIPRIKGWPNQGIGRVNPDGSKGACTACHPRHSFAIETARKAYTCSQCHVEPDVPAWDVWKESKHGNIVLSESSHFNWADVPWKVGVDFKAPTCSACHNALIINPLDDEIIAERTHNFGDRLWLRIFGLPTSHPQPIHGLTTTLKNPDGQPLPVTFDGRLAEKGLLSPEDMQARQARMSGVCGACHSTDWTNSHFKQFDAHVAEIDAMVLETTHLMSQAWSTGMADPANPFDEPLEHLWIRQWLINANAARYSSAMNGQDFAAFKYGWWGLSRTLAEIHEEVQE